MSYLKNTKSIVTSGLHCDRIVLMKLNGDFVADEIVVDDEELVVMDAESIPMDVCRGINSISSSESCCCLIAGEYHDSRSEPTVD
jgi:hypothetical protein